MTYYTDSWDEPDVNYPNPEESGYIHEDNLPNFDHVKDMLKGILEAVYQSGDTVKLDDCLDELTSCFDMKVPSNKPVLGNSGSARSDSMLDSWLNFNYGYNESLKQLATR